MGRPAKGARVLGPYRNRNRWQIIAVGADGTRTVGSYRSEAAALEAKQAATLSNPEKLVTVQQTIAEYQEHMRRRGRAPRTLDKVETSLCMLLVDVERPVVRISAELLRRCVQRRLSGAGSPETVKGDLRVAKTWLRWCVRQAYVPRSLLGELADVRVEAAPRRGKPQLTVDESRRYIAAGLAMAAEQPDCDGPVVALLPLLCGISGREVFDRTVRDLDCDGAELIIRRGKTANRRRRVLLPECIRPHVARFAADKAPGDLLFPGSRGQPRDNRHGRTWVHLVCERAGVPLVCPHGLRGTHSSIAREAGATGQLVASALGHSEAVNARHYTRREAAQRAEGRAVESRLRLVVG